MGVEKRVKTHTREWDRFQRKFINRIVICIIEIVLYLNHDRVNESKNDFLIAATEAVKLVLMLPNEPRKRTIQKCA